VTRNAYVTFKFQREPKGAWSSGGLAITASEQDAMERDQIVTGRDRHPWLDRENKLPPGSARRFHISSCQTPTFGVL